MADGSPGAAAVLDLTTDGEGHAGRTEGRVYAPDARIVLDRDFVLHGSLVAGAVRLDDRARVVAGDR